MCIEKAPAATCIKIPNWLQIAMVACVCVGAGSRSTPMLAQQQTSAASGRTLVRAGHVLDVKTGEEPAAQTIIVTGDPLTAIAPTNATPAQQGDKVVDLT